MVHTRRTMKLVGVLTTCTAMLLVGCPTGKSLQVSDSTSELAAQVGDSTSAIDYKASRSRTADRTAPVITLNGTTPVTIEVHTPYTDAGATATDNRDGTVPVTTTGTVNVNVVGTYTLTYTARDSAGNQATPKQRVVYVLDRTAPVVTMNGGAEVTIQLHSPYTDAGATATDNYDATVAVTKTGAVNVDVVGDYTLTYSAEDFSGNQAVPKQRLVHVNGQTPANENSPFGINLTGVIDYSTEWSFVDAFKSSRPWVSGTASVWDDGRALDLDANGWVRSLQSGQIAKTLLFWYDAGEARYPAGKYTVLYEGEGTLLYSRAASKDVAASTPGCDILNVDPTLGGFRLFITATNPANYLRNIRVIMPGGVSVNSPYIWTDQNSPTNPSGYSMFVSNYATQVFHPAFLDRIKTYTTIRFMNWMRTCEPEFSEWADRPNVNNAQWSAKGVPVEVMCDLANRLHANPWFNMHHLASDDYIRQFATIVRDNLDPTLKVYIEHSNEVWNPIYAEAAYARQQGLALGLSTNAFQAQIRYHSKRSVEIFQIWEQVFGGAGRLVRVMPGQAANLWVADTALSYNNAYQHVDAVAIAPYFGGYLGKPENQAVVDAMTMDELFTELQTVAVSAALDKARAHVTVAQKYGVDLIGYESGQSLVGASYPLQTDAVMNALFDAANRDPRMGDVYTQYYQGWQQLGVGLVNVFCNCKGYASSGRWGTLEHITQSRETAPKYDAVQRFIEQVKLAALAQ